MWKCVSDVDAFRKIGLRYHIKVEFMNKTCTGTKNAVK